MTIQPGDLVAVKRFKNSNVYFYVSDKPNKKYRAEVYPDKAKHYKIFYFGDTSYQHYKDAISSYWSHLDHNDEERRKLYHIRHKGDKLAKNFPSAGWFSANLLW